MIETDTDIQTAIKCRNGVMTVRRTQDVEPYLEANHAELNSHSDWRPYATTKRNPSNLRKIAEVPNIVVEQWLKEGVNIFSKDPDMQRKVRIKLDDYTNKKLRTMPGRVGVRKKHL